MSDLILDKACYDEFAKKWKMSNPKQTKRRAGYICNTDSLEVEQTGIVDKDAALIAERIAEVIDSKAELFTNYQYISFSDSDSHMYVIADWYETDREWEARCKEAFRQQYMKESLSVENRLRRERAKLQEAQDSVAKLERQLGEEQARRLTEELNIKIAEELRIKG